MNSHQAEWRGIFSSVSYSGINTFLEIIAQIEMTESELILTRYNNGIRVCSKIPKTLTEYLTTVYSKILYY
jgi:hypothetical protein